MPTPRREPRAGWALLSLLATQAVACHARRAPPQKPAPSTAVTSSAVVAASRNSGSDSGSNPGSSSGSNRSGALAAASAEPDPRASSAGASASGSACASSWPAPIELAALKTAPKSAALSPLRAEPGLWLADEHGVLLDPKPDPAWAEGPITLAGDNRATRGVTLRLLPKALRGWLGRPVKVLGARGLVCETRLQRFALSAQVTPDPRTAEHWEGCADGPAMPPELIAKEIWRLSAVGGRTLIAEFSAACKGALLAVDPNLPAPPIAPPEPAAPELGDAVMTAFRALPEYAALQARFRAEHPELEGAWDDRDARRNISKLALPGAPPLLFVSVETGDHCSGFSASLSAVWDSGPSGAARVLTAIDDRRLTPNAIVDLDGRGGSLLLGPDGPAQVRSVLRAGTFQRFFLSEVPYFAGPC